MSDCAVHVRYFPIPNAGQTLRIIKGVLCTLASLYLPLEWARKDVYAPVHIDFDRDVQTSHDVECTRDFAHSVQGTLLHHLGSLVCMLKAYTYQARCEFAPDLTKQPN